MIKSLKLENFQSHKDSLLRFNKGLNVIVGPSDNGKTSIIRAFRWVAENRPSGDDFRSYWGGATSISLNTFENNTIIRTKDKSINSYKLNKNEFVAFGQDVPEEIKKVLDLDNINIQQQLDAPFLLSETSGFVASHFNKVAKLEKIDKSRNYIQSEINKITNTINTNKSIINEKVNELATFINLESLESEIIKVEKYQSVVNSTLTNINSIKSLITNINNTHKVYINLQQKVIPEESIDRILLLYKKEASNKLEYIELKNIIEAIVTKSKKIKEAEKIIVAEDSIYKILRYYKVLTETHENNVKLITLYKSILAKEKTRKSALKQLTILENEFHKNFPNQCPLCDSKIK